MPGGGSGVAGGCAYAPYRDPFSTHVQTVLFGVSVYASAYVTNGISRCSATLDTCDDKEQTECMAFVKLDCGLLDSTLWPDREAREIFITALLMARPKQFVTVQRQLEVRTLKETGFEIPPGGYGFIEAAGSGIIRRAGMELESGLAALERLGSPELESRTPDFEGRRLIRVDGGYVALNYWRYRDKDHTAAERSKRYRQRRAPRNKRQIRNENLAREKRFVDAEGAGDVKIAGEIAAEGIPDSY